MLFIVLRKTGPGLDGAELAAIIEGKKKEEGEEAIAEGATLGPGSYVAIPFHQKDVVAKDARATVEIVDPVEQVEPKAPDSAEASVEEPS